MPSILLVTPDPPSIVKSLTVSIERMHYDPETGELIEPRRKVAARFYGEDEAWDYHF